MFRETPSSTLLSAWTFPRHRSRSTWKNSQVRERAARANEIRVAGLLARNESESCVHAERMRERRRAARTKATCRTSFETVVVSYYDPGWLRPPVWFPGLFVARAQTAWTARINHEIRADRLLPPLLTRIGSPASVPYHRWVWSPLMESFERNF